MSEEQLKSVMESLHRLPALPSVVMEVIDSFAETGISTTLLADKISRDQALSAKLLQVSNSSFYGLSRQVGSINEAVMVLGFDSVRTLTVAIGLIHGLSPFTDQLLNRKRFWQYNIQVATCARFLAKSLNFNSEIAFTAGLLHDIGQMALALTYPERYGLIVEHNQGPGLIESEQQEFGFDHAMLGAEVARHWNFPLAIQDAIKYHHDMDSVDISVLSGIIYIANFLHEQFRTFKTEEEIVSEFPSELYSKLNLNEKIIVSAIAILNRSDIGAQFLE
ncbi:MAG TPA: HDOD domain-containing protein [Burkholderiales bacterium]|nr:HDOD domain-containing protein [Burkholderiales bacterium]